jgi:methionyl-tRNA formyltransferase
MSLRFAFLVLQEHPYGREMLRAMLAHGFRPSLIVEESSPVADEEREKFLARIAGQPAPPTLAELAASQNIPRQNVDNHNSPAGREALEALKPELVVLGGTRIIRPPLLALPPRGTINAHPGLLPHLRGSASVGWALYKDLPIGATVHFVDPSIDTGSIILQRVLPVRRSDTCESINGRVAKLASELMAETLALFEQGEVNATPQDVTLGETLRVIPPELLEQAKTRLALGRYSHFADG